MLSPSVPLPLLRLTQRCIWNRQTVPSAWGYDAMSLLALAIKNAGTLDPDAIRDTLAATTDYQGATAISHFDENRHPIKYLELYTIRNGQIELYKVVSP